MTTYKKHTPADLFRGFGQALVSGYIFELDGDYAYVHNPEGTRYVITALGCSCPAKRYYPGMCKHERWLNGLVMMCRKNRQSYLLAHKGL